MVGRLPEIDPRGTLTQNPQSSVSAAEIANPYQQVANAFDSWGQTLQAKAEDDARIGGQNGVYRDANGAAAVDLKSNLGEAARIYNRSASQALVAQNELDAKGAMTQMQIDANGNPDTFKASAKAYKDQRLIATEKALRGPVGQVIDSEAQMGYDGLVKQKFESDMTSHRNVLVTTLAMKQDDMAALSRQGGTHTPEYQQARSQVQTLWNELSSNPVYGVSKEEADLRMKQAEGQNMAEAILGQADRAIQTGGVEEARKLSDQLLTDPNLQLHPAERRKYSGLVNEAIKSNRAEQKAAVEPLKELSKDRSKQWEAGIGLDDPADDDLIGNIAKGDLAYAGYLKSHRETLRQVRDVKNMTSEQQTAALEQTHGIAPPTGQVSPQDATAAKTFLLGRTDKTADAINGLQDGFAVKVSRMFQAAPPEIKDGLGVYSGMRTAERQAEIIAESGAKYGIDVGAWQKDVAALGPIPAGQKWAAEFKRTGLSENIGKPGGSNHQKGTAADLSYNGQSLKNAPANVVAWLHDNAGAYGLKFPLPGENWHIEDSSTRGGAPGQPADTTPPSAVTLTGEAAKALQASVTEDLRSNKDKWKETLLSGNVPDANSLDLLSRQLALVPDQSLRDDYATLFKQSAAFQSAYRADPAVAENFLSQLDASGSTQGFSLAQAQVVDAMHKGAQAAANARRDDPIGYGMKAYSSFPKMVDLDLASPDTWGPAFQSMQMGVNVLRARGDAGNISALRPQQEQVVANALARATPQDSIRLLGTMAKNLSPDTYKTTLSKLYASGQSAAVATAGALVPDNPQVAEGILRGQQLLAQNPLLAPKKTDDNAQTINSILPLQAFAPALDGARQGLLEAATARYADLSATSGDTSGELNQTRMDQAVKEITGGLVDVNGYQTIAPKYNMTQDDFDKVFSGLQDQDLMGAVTSSGTQVSAKDLRNEGRLRAVTDGRYVLEFGSQDHPSYAMRSAPSPTGGADLNSVYVLDLRNH